MRPMENWFGKLRENMKNKTRHNLIISLLLIFAFAVRIFNLHQAPSRLTHDEMSIGYNAFSMLKTGQDEWGRAWPLTFEAFGDHKLPGYIYASMPTIALFGLNVLGLKLPSILAGISAVWLVYLITKKLTQNDLPSFLAAFAMAFNPWSIHLSRMAFESNLAMAFFLGGLYFSLSFFDQKSNKFNFIFAGLFFALSIYTYIAFRLIIVLTLIALAFFSYRKQIKLNKFFYLILSLGLFLLPLTPQLFGTSNTARFSQVSVFADEGIAAKVTEQRNFCFLQQPTLLNKPCKILFNRYTYLAQKIATNYLDFILPTFLFLEGDELEYLNDPDFAQFLIIFLPFYFVGLTSLWQIKKSSGRFIIAIFFITPIASALVGPPQIVRGSALLPLVSVIIGLGLYATFENFKNHRLFRPFALLISLLFLFSFGQYFISYNYVYAAKYENYIYPLDQRIVEFIDQQENKYEKIYFSSHFPDAHILLAFYQKIDPSEYQESIIRPSPDKLGFSHPSQLFKYEFGDLSWHDLLCRNEEKTLFITFNNELPSEWKVSPAIQSIKDFSNVHTQVTMIDLGLVRDYLISESIYASTCSPTN